MKKDFTTLAVNQITFWLITKAQDWFYAFGKSCKNSLNPHAVIRVDLVMMCLSVEISFEFMGLWCRLESF